MKYTENYRWTWGFRKGKLVNIHTPPGECDDPDKSESDG